jgi:chemosensory pili system protein ChpA (sensor histidine kinase/response regulator)
MLETLDQSILLGFVEEAQSYLPTIRQGIAAFQNDSRRREEINQAFRQIHTVKGAALTIGLFELGETAGKIESALEPLTDGEGELDSWQSAALLAQLDEVEKMLDAKAEELRCAVKQQENQGNELDAPLPVHEEAEPQSNERASFALPTLEDEEVDPEMLEVFTLEAEEHLQNIGESLQLLEQNPHNGDALHLIRRSAHTLKGAAGVVGFKTTSGLAHRLEDLLDYLAENPFYSTPQTTALILAATDTLEKLSRGATAKDIWSELENLYARFDAALTGETKTIETVKNSLSEFAAAQQQIEKNAPTTVVAEKDVSAVVAAEEAITLEHAADAAQAVNAAALPQKTVVRVGLERLDELVKLMGEMVISRTALEQRLKDIENQLAEMRLSTNRLRRIALKLEVDYEASQLRGSVFGAKIFGNVGGELVVGSRFAGAFEIQNSKPEIENSQSNQDFDDLEFDRYTEFHELTRQLVETSTDTTSITADLSDLLNDFEAALVRQRRLSDELQEKMMRLRMVALGTIASRLVRTVRVTADAEAKSVDLEIEGEEIEIDTQVLSSLAEPLLHLLRNAVVHGIETPEQRVALEKPPRGTIKLRAFHEGTHIVLSITDDGRGINPETLREKALRENFITAAEAAKMTDEQALQLVFLSGFSTAKQLTENAGRGVGMDIVRESVVRQQGTISLKSTTGRGTTVIIRLPMSMAVTRSLIVRASGQRYALPLNAVQQLAQVAAEDFDQLTQEKILWVGSKFYPVYTLNEILELPAAPAERDNEQIPVLLVQAGEKTVALVLDEVIEAREIVIKPLNRTLFKMRGLLGATIFGDGAVVPILDLNALLNVEQPALTAETKPAEARQAKIRNPKSEIQVMIVDDSPSVRRVMSNFVAKAGMQAVVAKDGLEAIEILQHSRDLPDIVLSDVEMPRMDGYELLNTLKRNETFAAVPVVMITSRAGEKHRQRALELGASEYVTKPYQDSVLLEIIERLTK